MKINLESSPKEKTKEIHSKQEEICSLTKELRSHYFLGKYFVDPDKTFITLLEKIIVNYYLTTLEILRKRRPSS